MSLKVFLFGEEEKEPTGLAKETFTLEELLHKEKDPDERARYLGELKTIAEIEKVRAEAERREPPKPLISGDTLVKAALVIGLTYAGYKLETTGHILPKWFSITGPGMAVMKM